MTGKETGTILSSNQRSFLKKRAFKHSNPTKLKKDLAKIWVEMPERLHKFFSDFETLYLNYPCTSNEEYAKKLEISDVFSQRISDIFSRIASIEIKIPEVQEQFDKQRVSQFNSSMDYVQAQVQLIRQLREQFEKPRFKQEKEMLIRLYKEDNKLRMMEKVPFIPLDHSYSRNILSTLFNYELIVLDSRNPFPGKESWDRVSLTDKGRRLVWAFGAKFSELTSLEQREKFAKQIEKIEEKRKSRQEEK